MTAAIFMLDTDTCIFLTRGESAVLAARVQSVPLQNQVMSAVTLAELTFGVLASAASKRKQNQAVLDSLALHLAVLDWPQEAAQHYAEIRLWVMRPQTIRVGRLVLIVDPQVPPPDLTRFTAVERFKRDTSLV